jgi:opacity protein-like surface antigen
MNEQNFDKTLKQKMAEERDFPFSEDKWDKMERKLDDFHAQKRYNRLVWASALSFVGLLGVLLFVMSQLRDTKSALSDLTQRIQKGHVAQPSIFADSVRKGTVIQRDTVYHHIIIKRHDTIFQTVVQRGLPETEFKKMSINKTIIPSETKISAIDSAFMSFKKSDLSIPNTVNTDEATKSTIDSPNPKIDHINAKVGQQSADRQVSTPDKPIPKSEIDTLKSEIAPPLSIPYQQTGISNEKTSNQPKPILKPLSLTGYEVGLSSGRAFIGDRDIKQQMGYSIGIRGSIGVRERFKVVGEAQYVGLYYKLNKNATRNDIPTIPPPTGNDELSYIQVRQSAGLMYLGLQYDITRSRLRPFVGVGAVGAFEVERKYNFKFINNLTNVEQVISTKNRSKDFDDVYWRVSAGLSYPVFKKMKVQLEGSFDAPFDHKHYNQPLLQLKGVVVYRF